MGSKVIIDCPRCGGRGSSNFWPGSGICFRCRGKGIVTIDVEAHRKVLNMLRNKYRFTRRQLRKEKDPYEREFLETKLGFIEVDGTRVSAELEYAETLLEDD